MSHFRRFARIVLAIGMLLRLELSLARPTSASAQGGDGAQRQLNTQTTKLSFVGPEIGRALPATRALGISAAARPADPAMALAKRFGPEFGLKNPEQDLSHIKTVLTSDGRRSVRYQQVYQGIPVLGGELIVNTNENGDLYSINGEVAANLSLPTQPAIGSEQARQAALQAIAKWYRTNAQDFVVSEPELWIYDESLLQKTARPVELVWRMEVTAADDRFPVRELVLVSAQRGNISLHFNQVDGAWAASGNARANPALETTATTKGALAQSVTAVVRTYTAGNGTVLPGTFLCDQTAPGCTNGSNPHADKAHGYAIGTYNLYQSNHNRNSIDNQNMPVVSTVHYDSGYANAFWSGEQMVYGDGYGFPSADDVVAHELTHGVTQHESNLFYYYQSGAINESFSDLWGEYYDQTNGKGTDTAAVKWQIGEDISGLGAIRSMSNPPAFGNPDKMSSVYYSEGEDDNGGVHSNSGLNNKAVFLMVAGGTFNGKTVTALGWAKTAAIYYETNTNLLSSGADYSDLYYALQRACSNLVGQKGITSANCIEVKDAVDAVEMNGQPAQDFNTDAPVCSMGTPNITFVDDLENGAAQWNFSNGGTTRWQVDSPYYGQYAQSGIHSLYADDYPAAITDANARLAAFMVPNNAYLHFAHAFGFESYGTPYHFDGGVLEYSLNGGSTWLDAGSLIDFNGYKGTIYTDWNNPLRGRPAFVGSSHGYISTRLNLASLAGQTVTFRWRMGLDDAVSAWGWWVDNLKVYTCQSVSPVADNWYIYGVGSALYGTGGDIPVAADYDGDGKADIAVFRPSTSTWHIYGVGDFIYGMSGDIPVVADYNGDHKADIAVFRPSTSTWHIYGVGDIIYGTSGDKPVLADYNGDGKADIAVFRPSTSTWHVYGMGDFVYGMSGDIPVVADYNGDRRADIAVFRP
jgi:Zn-dependent metalloprotease